MPQERAIPPHIRWLFDGIRNSGRGPTMIQTHVSVILLDGEQVLKFKKPVQFDFIDLRSLEERRRVCESEVRLNSRLCPGLYFGVVPITASGDGYHIGGDSGEVVDYAVGMRQLSAEGMLDSRIARGDVTLDMIGAIAGKMARFHAGAEATPEIREKGGLATFAGNWRENLASFAAIDESILPSATRARIEAFALAESQRLESLLRRREEAGMVRDGHGDLRADAIWINPRDANDICIFDCLEFNERYRFSDTGLDIAFLAMDLEAKGRRDLSDLLIGLYCQASGDGELPLLLPLFKCYRAVVRGKVRSLFQQQPEVEEAQRAAAREEAAALFQLAASYTAPPGKPRVVLVCGLSGSGKSFLAGAIAARMGAAVISTDVTRKKLAGVAPTEPIPAAYGAGAYSAEMTERVYASIIAAAEEQLVAGHAVVLDGTYTRREQRDAVAAMAKRAGVPLLVAECRVPDDVIRERQERRAGDSWKASDATWQTYLAQKAAADPIDEVPSASHLFIDTTGSLPDLLALLEQRLK